MIEYICVRKGELNLKTMVRLRERIKNGKTEKGIGSLVYSVNLFLR